MGSLQVGAEYRGIGMGTSGNSDRIYCGGVIVLTQSEYGEQAHSDAIKTIMANARATFGAEFEPDPHGQVEIFETVARATNDVVIIWRFPFIQRLVT